MLLRKTYLLSLFLVISVHTIAQTNYNLWTNISVEKEVIKNLELSLEEEARFSSSSFQLDRLITEINASYKFNKYYNLGAGYRFTYYTKGVIGSRFTLSNKVKYKLADFTLNYRLNFQTDIKTNDAIYYKIRNRIGVGYKINKKWSTEIKGELFYSMYNYGNLWDRYRISYGLDYKINKHHKINPNMMFQQEFNVAAPEKDFIFSIKYKYSF